MPSIYLKRGASTVDAAYGKQETEAGPEVDRVELSLSQEWTK